MIAFLKDICEKLNFKKSADDNLSMNILKVSRRQLDGEERAGGFASWGIVMVEWLLPGATGLSAVCDCGIA